jgi:hypothetical protein
VDTVALSLVLNMEWATTFGKRLLPGGPAAPPDELRAAQQGVYVNL